MVSPCVALATTQATAGSGTGAASTACTHVNGPLLSTLGAVHFTPCAHTAWHRHSLGQTLCVTEGEGFVQARAGQVIRIRPGDVIVTAPGEWHWHGATPTTFMTHLALTEGDTEWGDHLTDEGTPANLP